MIYTVKSLYQITKNCCNMPFWLIDLDTTDCKSVIFKKQLQCLIPHYKICCSKTCLQQNIKTL